MNTPLFIILFADNDTYYGKKDYFNSGWKEIPDKSIKKIFFRMPTGDYFIMSEYSRYYQYIECTKILSGESAGKTQIQNIHILGQKKDKVIEYKIHVLSGDIKVHLFDENNEYVKSLNKIGWKK
jgi:hypothetical protein